MIHEALPTLTETAFGSHPCCEVSVTYVRTHCFHGGNTGFKSRRGRQQNKELPQTRRFSSWSNLVQLLCSSLFHCGSSKLCGFISRSGSAPFSILGQPVRTKVSRDTL